MYWIMKPFYVYILKCSDQSYYVGHTDDIEKRFLEHSMGLYHGYTNARLPVELVYSAKMVSRDVAFKREMQIKKWSRKKKEALINDDSNTLVILARKKF